MVSTVDLLLKLYYPISKQSRVIRWFTECFPFSAVGNSLITTCEGSTKHGSVVSVDFYQINSPCTCTVTPLFAGDLLVSSRQVLHFCDTRVIVQKGIIFGCPLSSFSSQIFNVQINQTVTVQAEYIPPSSTGTFYHCLRFEQNGMNFCFSIVCWIIIIT